MQETPSGPQQLLLQEIATELFETDFRPDKRGERLRYTLTPVFPLYWPHTCVMQGCHRLKWNWFLLQSGNSNKARFIYLDGK